MPFLCDIKQLHILELFEGQNTCLGKVVLSLWKYTDFPKKVQDLVFNKGIAGPVFSDSFRSNVFLLVFYFFSPEDLKMFN